MADPVQSFYTLQSLATVGGASAAVIIISNTYRKLSKSDSVIPPFVISLIISFVGAFEANAWLGVTEAFLILLNSCMLYCSALGVQETVVSVVNRPPPGTISEQGKEPVKWLSSWIYKKK